MDFEKIWEKLSKRGRVAYLYRTECEYIWKQFSPEQQQAIYNAICKKIEEGRFIHFNPANAIRDNVPQQTGPQILSFDDYYKRYGTTEDTDGWHRKFLPEEHKTIYVKSPQ